MLYARVVAGFSAGDAPASVEAVIELARALGAELQAVLLEDVAALAMAEWPSTRAFDARAAAWRELRPGELLQELELAAAALRRSFEQARLAGLRAQVAVERGGPGEVLAQYAKGGDLLVVTEPADPMARWVQPFAGLLDAALASPAALLYLPHRRARHGGPVAAIGSVLAEELAQRVAQALGVPHLSAGPAAESSTGESLHAWLPRLRALRVRLAVCERAALAADPARALHEAGDLGIAVLVAPRPEGR